MITSVVPLLRRVPAMMQIQARIFSQQRTKHQLRQGLVSGETFLRVYTELLS